MLNSDLDIETLANRYGEDNRARLTNILAPESAEQITQCCETKLPFDFIYHLDGQNKVTSAKDMAAMNIEEQKSLHKKLLQAASQGIGFLYGGHMMNRSDEESNPELAILYEFYNYLGSEEALEVFRKITGIQELSGVDAQFTRYTPGQFLTRHSDNITEEGRRVAFVFSFSRAWHPDWGGLLQFYEANGTPRDAWSPEFNSLALFDVQHIHSVSYVAPFAAAPRLSFTGWFTTGSSNS